MHDQKIRPAVKRRWTSAGIAKNRKLKQLNPKRNQPPFKWTFRRKRRTSVTRTSVMEPTGLSDEAR